MTMRFWLVLAIVAASAGAAQAQSLPCDAFARTPEGVWQATRNVGIPGAGRTYNINQGAIFKPGSSFMGLELAAELEKECPAAVEAAKAVETQVELPKYEAPNGNIDTANFTCAQFSNLPPEDADFLGTWTVGWQNGVAKNRAINVAKVREAIRGVSAYCKANKDKKFVQAVDVVMKTAR